MKKHLSILAAAALLLALFLADWAKAMQAVYATCVLAAAGLALFAGVKAANQKTNP